MCSTINWLLSFLEMDFLGNWIHISHFWIYYLKKITIEVYLLRLQNNQWLIDYQIPLIVIARQPKFQSLWALVNMLYLKNAKWHFPFHFVQQMKEFQIQSLENKIFCRLDFDTRVPSGLTRNWRPSMAGQPPRKGHHLSLSACTITQKHWF